MKPQTKLKTLIVTYNKETQLAAAHLDKANAAKDKILELMLENGIASTSAELETGDIVYGTLVQSSTLVIDLDELRDAIPARILKKVTKSSVDMNAFRNAVASGEIDTDVANHVSSEKARTPYVRFGNKPPREDE